MHDLPTLIALAGVVFWLVVTVAMYAYASRHYTRLPGAKWTTWEKVSSTSVGSVLIRVDDEEGAA